jgi:hypothetical protein
MSAKSSPVANLRLAGREELERNTARAGDTIALRNPGDSRKPYVPAIILHYAHQPKEHDTTALRSYVYVLPIDGNYIGRVVKISANLGPKGNGAGVFASIEDPNGKALETRNIFGEPSEIHENVRQKISEMLQVTIRHMVLNEQIKFVARDELLTEKAFRGAIVALRSKGSYEPAIYLGSSYKGESGVYSIMPILGRDAGKAIEAPILSISKSPEDLGPSLTKIFLSAGKSK